MIDKETIERIVGAARIEEVVGDFVSLKKRGANHVGCCPFHDERTPSFYVSPSKGIFKCFGCGEAGDAVAFVMKHEHYSYPEALRYLARKYNIEVREEAETEAERERQKGRDALFNVTEFAQGYFARTLTADEEGRAVGLAYLRGRGLTDAAVARFGLGYCKDEWSAFTDCALRSGYSPEVLVRSGLTVVKEESGHRFDRFRGRVMFPIYSISGRVLGFSGRVLGKGRQVAKYVNSPDSEIYNKSRTLYGLYQARTAIGRADKCYLVEGNVDVISMFQSGVENVVASCGTSLTTEQIRLIKRYTTNVTVLYDGDSAGIKAALRAVGMLFEEGMHVRVVLFPDGEDPDSYAQKYGSSRLQDYLAQHEDNFIVYKTKVLLDDVKSDPIRRAEAMREVVETIALVPDLLERQGYVLQCAELFGVPEATLAAELGAALRRRAARQGVQQGAQPQAEGRPDAVPAPEPQPGPAGPEPAPVDAFADPREVQLVRLLLNYGDRMIAFGQTGADGTPTLANRRLADLLVEEVQADDLRFDNAVCQQIFDLYAAGVAAGRLPDHAALAAADPAVRAMAFSLMVDTYSISDLWRRKSIVVPRPDDRLKEELTDSLLGFKLLKIDHLIAENNRRLKSLQPDDDVMLLLAERKQLNDIRRQLGLALNRIVT